MNRIILIGNGFDLAHGLPTNYHDFIKDFWDNKLKKIEESPYDEKYEDDDIMIDSVSRTWIGNNENSYQYLRQNCGNYFHFKNFFLKKISIKNNIQNWVDIEDEYYFHLKEIYLGKIKDYDIKTLNTDFEKIKNYLELYLEKIVSDFEKETRLINNIGNIIYSDFNFKNFTENSINKKAREEYEKIKNDLDGFEKNQISITELDEPNQKLIYRLSGEKDHYQKIRKLLFSYRATEFFNLAPQELLFLNFNYTYTDLLYSNKSNYHCFDNTPKDLELQKIRIHGRLNAKQENPIIFGYGDEIDDDYKLIEKKNDNEYLENIKSIKYLETDNYKKLLEFINSDGYQIFIFGHSCGISDRTLLNTLFEHENCVSIKPFYYIDKNGKDNYSDIVRNISRNFNNKAVMRDKVVNKKDCETLIR